MSEVLSSQLMRDRCVEIPFAGKFLLIGDGQSVIRFIPSLELLTSGPF